MRYEIDRKHRIVDFFIEDNFGREHRCGMSFKEARDLLENVVWDILNPQMEEEKEASE